MSKTNNVLIITVSIVLIVILYYGHDYTYSLSYFKHTPPHAHHLPYFPVDVVYTWVNGADLNWVNEKNKYKTNYNDQNSTTRWRDNNTLKYSLRGLDKYAPWIRNVYLVTCMSQVPEWLNTDTVKVIDHTEIIPSECLPTFSSLSIESCIHKIPNLSEYFLYFNDDIMLSDYTCRDDFFSISENDKILRKVFRSKTMNCYLRPVVKYFNEFTFITQYTRDLINKMGYNNCIFGIKHAPYVLSVSQIYKKQSEYTEQYYNTICSKFREPMSIYDCSYFDAYWSLLNGYAVDADIKDAYINVDNNLKKNINKLYDTRHKAICIQDGSCENIDECHVVLQEFLDIYYPHKSKYEKN
jgi:hypothetical protein